MYIFFRCYVQNKYRDCEVIMAKLSLLSFNSSIVFGVCPIKGGGEWATGKSAYFISNFSHTSKNLEDSYYYSPTLNTTCDSKQMKGSNWSTFPCKKYLMKVGPISKEKALRLRINIWTIAAQTGAPHNITCHYYRWEDKSLFIFTQLQHILQL